MTFLFIILSIDSLEIIFTGYLVFADEYLSGDTHVYVLHIS